jgi:hypothetical protein
LADGFAAASPVTLDFDTGRDLLTRLAFGFSAAFTGASNAVGFSAGAKSYGGYQMSDESSTLIATSAMS